MRLGKHMRSIADHRDLSDLVIGTQLFTTLDWCHFVKAGDWESDMFRESRLKLQPILRLKRWK